MVWLLPWSNVLLGEQQSVLTLNRQSRKILDQFCSKPLTPADCHVVAMDSESVCKSLCNFSSPCRMQEQDGNLGSTGHVKVVVSSTLTSLYLPSSSSSTPPMKQWQYGGRGVWVGVCLPPLSSPDTGSFHVCVGVPQSRIIAHSQFQESPSKEESPWSWSFHFSYFFHTVFIRSCVSARAYNPGGPN